MIVCHTSSPYLCHLFKTQALFDLSLCRHDKRDLTAVLPFIIPLTLTLIGKYWGVMCSGLHVDLGILTSTRWACGLLAASLLLFCLYNGITSAKQKKEHSQQFLGQAALFSHLGASWGFGSRAAEQSLPVRAHTDTRRLETISHGISCRSLGNENAGSTSDNLALLWKLPFWKNTLFIPCVCCNNLTDIPCDI